MFFSPNTAEQSSIVRIVFHSMDLSRHQGHQSQHSKPNEPGAPTDNIDGPGRTAIPPARRRARLPRCAECSGYETHGI